MKDFGDDASNVVPVPFEALNFLKSQNFLKFFEFFQNFFF